MVEPADIPPLPPPLGDAPWVVMGILNVTPDSFHDRGRHGEFYAAVERGREMVAAGAGIIDIGGESTRPGAETVPLEEELGRVIPVVEALAAELEVPISVDTYKSQVARAAIDAGAEMINDITALSGDRHMVEVAADSGCMLCLMHMQGTPRNMQKNPHYDDVVGEITNFLRQRVEYAVSCDVQPENIIIDPGIGFGKTAGHNLSIMRRLDRFLAVGQPLLLGASRKRFIGAILEDGGTDDRLTGTVATTVLGYQKGVRIFRVHDVKENVEALKVAAAVAGAE